MNKEEKENYFYLYLKELLDNFSKDRQINIQKKEIEELKKDNAFLRKELYYD